MTALQKMAAFARNIQHSGERMQENPWKSWGCLLDGFNHVFKVGKLNVWENIYGLLSSWTPTAARPWQEVFPHLPGEGC